MHVCMCACARCENMCRPQTESPMNEPQWLDNWHPAVRRWPSIYSTPRTDSRKRPGCTMSPRWFLSSPLSAGCHQMCLTASRMGESRQTLTEVRWLAVNLPSGEISLWWKHWGQTTIFFTYRTNKQSSTIKNSMFWWFFRVLQTK